MFSFLFTFAVFQKLGVNCRELCTFVCYFCISLTFFILGLGVTLSNASGFQSVFCILNIHVIIISQIHECDKSVITCYGVKDCDRFGYNGEYECERSEHAFEVEYDSSKILVANQTVCAYGCVA